LPSFYCPELGPLKRGDTFILKGTEFHHLKVAKRRAAEALRLNSGTGRLATAELLSSTNQGATLKILEITDYPALPHPYAIGLSLLKNRNDELAVEKCTELGAEAFFPLLTEFSVRQASCNTASRFSKIALAAIKQCDNPWLPEVFQPLPLATAVKVITERGFTPIVCSERKPERWLHHLGLEPGVRPCFLIGPEGGWGKADFAVLGGLPEITLGPLITRAETAAIAIAAQWLAYANR